MAIAEGLAAKVGYKFYTGGAITSATEPVPATDPGPTGFQLLRNTECTLSLSKDTYQSNERSATRQVRSMRHGVRRVQGGVNGEWSPGTYFRLLEASLLGTATLNTTITEATATSIAADGTAGTFTFGGGVSCYALGLRTGETFRLTNVASNTTTNFTITSMAGLVATVYPKPVTMAADTTFTLTKVGGKVFIPDGTTNAHVQRKLAVCVDQTDIDISKLFTECRMNGFSVRTPATGMATIELPIMGRNQYLFSGASAPFMTSPTVETGTEVLAAVGGLLMVGGTKVGLVTGLDVSATLNASADPVWGQNVVPDIKLGRVVVTGTLTAMLEDNVFLEHFINEDAISVIANLKADSGLTGDFTTMVMPKIKFTGADNPSTGEGGQTISMPFQALLPSAAEATAGGFDQSTFILQDSAAV